MCLSSQVILKVLSEPNGMRPKSVLFNTIIPFILSPSTRTAWNLPSVTKSWNAAPVVALNFDLNTPVRSGVFSLMIDFKKKSERKENLVKSLKDDISVVHNFFHLAINIKMGIF